MIFSFTFFSLPLPGKSINSAPTEKIDSVVFYKPKKISYSQKNEPYGSEVKWDQTCCRVMMTKRHMCQNAEKTYNRVQKNRQRIRQGRDF